MENYYEQQDLDKAYWLIEHGYVEFELHEAFKLAAQLYKKRQEDKL